MKNKLNLLDYIVATSVVIFMSICLVVSANWMEATWTIFVFFLLVSTAILFFPKGKDFFYQHHFKPFIRYHIRLVGFLITFILFLVGINDYVFVNYSGGEFSNVFNFIDYQKKIYEKEPLDTLNKSISQNVKYLIIVDKTASVDEDTAFPLNVLENKGQLITNITKNTSVKDSSRLSLLKYEDLVVLNLAKNVMGYRNIRNRRLNIVQFYGKNNKVSKGIDALNIFEGKWKNIFGFDSKPDQFESIVQAYLNSLSGKYVKNNTYLGDLTSVIDEEIDSATFGTDSAQIMIILLSDFKQDLSYRQPSLKHIKNGIKNLSNLSDTKVINHLVLFQLPTTSAYNKQQIEIKNIYFEEFNKYLKDRNMYYYHYRDFYNYEESNFNALVGSISAINTKTEKIYCIPDSIVNGSIFLENGLTADILLFDENKNDMIHFGNTLPKHPQLADGYMAEFCIKESGFPTGIKHSFQFNDVKNLVPLMILKVFSILIFLLIFALFSMLIFYFYRLNVCPPESDKRLVLGFLSCILAVIFALLWPNSFFDIRPVFYLLESEVPYILFLVFFLLVIPSIFYWNNECKDAKK